MHDEPDVWLIDAHPEGDGGANDLHAVLDPTVLDVRTLLVSYKTFKFGKENSINYSSYVNFTY